MCRCPAGVRASCSSQSSKQRRWRHEFASRRCTRGWVTGCTARGDRILVSTEAIGAIHGVGEDVGVDVDPPRLPDRIRLEVAPGGGVVGAEVVVVQPGLEVVVLAGQGDVECKDPARAGGAQPG